MIGLFDSGSGGLTVLRALREELPSADVVYYGDIARAPYGERTRQEISQNTVRALCTLQKQGARVVISACNSVSASMVISLYDVLDFAPETMIEMVGPTVTALRDTNRPIVVAATPATIASELYQSAFAMVGKECATVPLPGLAGAIETDDQGLARTIITGALPELPNDAVLVLACTHYPLVESLFREVIKESVSIYDPAWAVAERAKQMFWPREVANGTTKFLITAESQPFRGLVDSMFPTGTYTIEVIP